MRPECHQSLGSGGRAGRVRPERRPDPVDQELSVVAHRVPDDDHGVVLRALRILIRAPSAAFAVMMSGRIVCMMRSASSTDDAGTTANFSLTSTVPATSPTAP